MFVSVSGAAHVGDHAQLISGMASCTWLWPICSPTLV